MPLVLIVLTQAAWVAQRALCRTPTDTVNVYEQALFLSSCPQCVYVPWQLNDRLLVHQNIEQLP